MKTFKNILPLFFGFAVLFAQQIPEAQNELPSEFQNLGYSSIANQCVMTETEDTTHVSEGRLYENTRWTKENSPYLLHGRVTVDTSVILTVDAGVRIIFDNTHVDNLDIIVEGSISMNGAYDDSIYIEGLILTPNNRSFRGIRCMQTSEACTLRYVVTRQALYGVQTYAQSTYVANCNFHYVGIDGWYGIGGISIQANGAVVRDCIFQGLPADDFGKMHHGINCNSSDMYLDISKCQFYTSLSVVIDDRVEGVFVRMDSCSQVSIIENRGANSHFEIYNCLFFEKPYANFNNQAYFSIINCTIYNMFTPLLLSPDTVVLKNNCFTSGFHEALVLYPWATYDISHNNIWNFYFDNLKYIGDSIALDGILCINVGVNANGDSCDFFGNISTDPFFVDEMHDNFSLRSNSPLIDAGDPSIRDPDGTPSDIGAYFFDQGTTISRQTPEFTNLVMFPNPFNNKLTITFEIQNKDQNIANVEIYSVKGDLINRIVAEQYSNILSAKWDGRDFLGHDVASGVYLVRVGSGMEKLEKKVVFVK